MAPNVPCAACGGTGIGSCGDGFGACDIDYTESTVQQPVRVVESSVKQPVAVAKNAS